MNDQIQQAPAKKQMAPWKAFALGALAMLILMSLINANSGSTTSATEPLTAPEQQAAMAPASAPATGKWTKIKTFTGSGTKNTEKFSVSSEWKIKWTTKPGNMGSSNFSLTLDDDAGEMVGLIANVIGKSVDESYQHTGGTFYLEILSGQPYVIEIWDKR
jgi:hypothetical protein